MSVKMNKWEYQDKLKKEKKIFTMNHIFIFKHSHH